MKSLALVIVLILSLLITVSSAFAIYDPLSTPNNKLGIHIISGTLSEASEAADLVNSAGGDWGYITVLIESQNRDKNRWQNFFDELRRRHLIPLVRLATTPVNDYWRRPQDNEEQIWADFLDSLYWPTKNRYIIVYNEPNHATEWENQIDAKNYAIILDKTIKALKAKSEDFFVLNAGFDASAPQKLPLYEDEANFILEMNQAVPGIFSELDGWVSRSYPNPNFSGLPDDIGRGTVNTWVWELSLLQNLGIKNTLPVFITETGWKHAEGLNYDKSLPSAVNVSNYFKEAFEETWNNEQIVAITPFLLNYQETPFDHFSFKKPDGKVQTKEDISIGKEILGVEYPEYYPQYLAIKNLNKLAGFPIQEDKATLIDSQFYSSLVTGETYTFTLTFKNTGQSIWNEKEPTTLRILGSNKLPVLVTGSSNNKFNIENVVIPPKIKIEPDGVYTFAFRIKAPTSGQYNINFNLFKGEKQFKSSPFEFVTEVKSPVILKIQTSLKWKNNFVGEYLLNTVGKIGSSLSKIVLGSKGFSEEMESKNLLPDYNYNFTLEKNYYKPKTISQTLHSGLNILDFGELEPDIPSAILHPKDFWKLFPFSN